MGLCSQKLWFPSRDVATVPSLQLNGPVPTSQSRGSTLDWCESGFLGKLLSAGGVAPTGNGQVPSGEGELSLKQGLGIFPWPVL